MAERNVLLAFVHGWSVTNTGTYGGLPPRLRDEALAQGIELRVQHVLLGRYISFHDEVRLPDLSRAFAQACRDEIEPTLRDGERFVCITHSTGGPVVRDWWRRYYRDERRGRCPMSHLIMLAPANFGSALAQLGKGRLGRLKAWLGGVEPGQGVLDWLELGSREAWVLNESWIHEQDDAIGANGIFPFVLTGQTIDRKFYDHLNSYTGESGSDGVVRVAGANLNARSIRLLQETPRRRRGQAEVDAPKLAMDAATSSPATALGIVPGASHSGRTRGIMRAVRKQVGHRKGRAVVAAILDCLSVTSKRDYGRVAAAFSRDNERLQASEAVEVYTRGEDQTDTVIHDRYSMLVFRVTDDEGYPVTDFDLLLTAGPDSDPDALPRGFFRDRQQNRVDRSAVTYFLNYDVMRGAPERTMSGTTLRPASQGTSALGIRLQPRPGRGFVRYLPCELPASAEFLEQALRPNATTHIDIRIRRVVHKNTFRLGRMEGDKTSGDFKRTRPGPDIVDSD